MGLSAYLDECRALVTDEIRVLIPADGPYRPILYDLMLDYPLREGKGLRPALCIATCRALGAKLDAVLRSAAVLELYHNAFLIHDDIEDESLMRRGAPTLHREHGVSVAVNVGDGMLALTLRPLLQNIGVVGLGPALRILDAVSRMVEESVHGQALELDWVRRSVWDIGDDDYVRMVELKTGWYSFIAPVLIGGIAARLPEERSQQLADFARSLGIAFQIQDDLLNLDGDEVAYGKESCGDLWEGKRTLVLLHLMRSATDAERAEIHRILALPRPRQPHEANGAGRLSALLEELSGDGHLTAEGRTRLQDALAPAAPACKQTDDVLHLRALIDRYGSVEYARGVAGRWARDAAERLDACRAWMLPSVHLDFLQELVEYVHARER